MAAAKPDLVVLGNARALLSKGEEFVRAIAELRDRLGARPILWAPRTALPNRLALLTYLSVDMFDTLEGEWRASEGYRVRPDLGQSASPIPDSPVPRESVEPTYASELALVRVAIEEHRLRELVEVRLGSEPLLAELLRYADRNLGDLLEERAPVVDDTVGRYVYRESFQRPEARRYRTRFRERYRPPPSKRVLLLVPCSRRKPYRLSRSHRRFASALEGLAPLERVHWVSVTSPLGVVPRELEDMPPAKNYDIPVTGDWDEAERASVVEGVHRLLVDGPYTHVISHLDPEEYRFLREAWPGPIPAAWSRPPGSSTGAEALRALSEAVGTSLEGIPPVPGGVLAVVREELESLGRMQWGGGAAESLFASPLRLTGRPWFQKLTDGKGTDLAVWTEKRGLFQLTVPGARRLLPNPPLNVEIDPAVQLKGDVFVPGILRADAGIRVGDAVTLTRSGTLMGVGEARLPGRLMGDLARGMAVRVRHRTPESIEQVESVPPAGRATQVR